ncbi:unnamed protein product, partial [Cuscuta europaea]
MKKFLKKTNLKLNVDVIVALELVRPLHHCLEGEKLRIEVEGAKKEANKAKKEATTTMRDKMFTYYSSG